MMKYSVIVISKDNREMMAACLRRLTAEVAGRAEIVAVEAGGAADLGVPGVRHITPPLSEAGFSSQRNAGVREASGEYVIFIDDDVEVPPGWFAGITAGPHEDPWVSGCMGAVFPKPTGVLSFIAGVLGHPGGGFRLHQLSGGLPLTLPQIATCNTLMRKADIVSAGGFNQAVLFGTEDTEISIRITRRFGPDRFRYLPQAVVWHYTKNTPLPFLKWYLRRGNADTELLYHAPEQRAYFVRSSVLLKVLAVFLLAWGTTAALLPAAFLAWYLLQARRMRFMWDYFRLYEFSRAERLWVYAAAPLVKLSADVMLDLGRIKRMVITWMNA
jgi:GT2 family glycosyltransferase